MTTLPLPTFDPVHDVLHYEHQALDAIFRPKNVAVVGATETQGSVGRTLVWNLISSPFGGAVFPINPNARMSWHQSLSSLRDVPEQVDLAVIVTPSPSVPGIIKDAVDTGIRGAIVISAASKRPDPPVLSSNAK